jgi:hypothetical protein
VKLVSQAFHDVVSKERRRCGWKGKKPKARNHGQWYTSSRVRALSDGLCSRGYPQSNTELDLLMETQIRLQARRDFEKKGWRNIQKSDRGVNEIGGKAIVNSVS